MKLTFRFLLFAAFLSISTTSLGNDNTLLNFGIEVPKNAVQHVSQDPNGRWNFVFLSETQLHITITDKSFVPTKVIDVKKVNQYGLHQIVGFRNTAKEILVFFHSSNEKNLKILSLHKFNENVKVIATEYIFKRNHFILKSFSSPSHFHIMVKDADSDDLKWISIDDEKKVKEQSVKTSFSLASNWLKKARSYPQSHCWVNNGQKSTFRENSVPVKIYPKEKQVFISFDEPFKTHFFTLDLSSFTHGEKLYNVNFPENIPIAGNQTNSYLHDGELFQMIAGTWGFGLQKYKLVNDSCSKTLLYRTADEMSEELSRSFKDFSSQMQPQELSLASSMSKMSTATARFGFSCSGSKTRLTFSAGFTSWKKKPLLTTPSASVPRQPSTKIEGIKYDLISPLNQIGQQSYNNWTRVNAVYTCFAISNWDFEPIKYTGMGITNFPKIRELETQMVSGFVLSSYNTIFHSENDAYFGFYQKGKRLYHVVKL